MSNRISRSCAFNYVLPVGATGAAILFDFNKKGTGIDCVEDSIAHEINHQIVDARQFSATGAWKGLNDTDNDEIPDVIENGSQLLSGWNLSKLGFNPNNRYSFAGFPYGDDEEVLCEMVGMTAKGNSANDWANQGKQSDPSYKRLITETGTNANLTGTFTDNGFDADSNSLYDYLVVNAEVDVGSAGTYTLFANLHDSGGNIVSAENYTYLDVGISIVQLRFDGKEFRRNRVDGSYTLTELALFAQTTQDDSHWGTTHNTSYYDYTQFEKTEIWFTGGFSESTIDSNSNGLYDYLVLGVDVEVSAGGNYTVQGYMYDGRRVVIAENSTELGVGSHTLNLNFNGLEIRGNRGDGPYSLGYLTAVEQQSYEYDTLYDAHNTSAYSYDQFEKPVIEFTGSFGESGIDTDSNGLYNYVRFQAEVDAEAGDYIISAHLYDSNETEILNNHTTLSLSAGVQNVTIDFTGLVIGEYGVDGPYVVGSLSLHDSAGAMISVWPDPLNTSHYSYIQFESKARIMGKVVDFDSNPVESATIYLSGAVSRVAQTDSGGNYSFTGLQAGAYNLLVVSLDPNLKTGHADATLGEGGIEIVDVVLDQAGSIEGYVYLMDGTPVANVTLYWDAYEPPRYRTDEAGYYVMPGINAGTYTLHADPPEGSELISATDTVDVILGNTTVTNFTLARGSNITGYVVDLNGTPIPNVYIDMDPGYDYTYTNSSGGYLFTLIPNGVYTLTATPGVNNLLDNYTVVDVGIEETVYANITVPWGGIIRSNVTDPEGNPVSGAYVDASGTDWGSCYTASDGTCEIDSLNTGSYTVTVSPPSTVNLLSNYTTIDVVMGETSLANITLPRGGLIRSNITDPDGSPVPNAYVVTSGPAYRSCYTDSTGICEILQLVSGNYTVTVTPPSNLNLLSNVTTVEVFVGETTWVNMTLPLGGVLTGFVVDVNGTPIYSAYVRITDPVSTYDYTDVNGNYSFYGLDTGTYSMYSSYSGYATAYTAANVTAGMVTLVNFTMIEGAEITGYITLENGFW